MIQANQIKPEMPIVCSRDAALGVVDHMEGSETIKLKKDGKGKHHFIPLAWVKSLDSKVHIDRPGEQAMKEWSDSAPAKAAAGVASGDNVAGNGSGNGQSYGKTDGKGYKADGKTNGKTDGKAIASAKSESNGNGNGNASGKSFGKSENTSKVVASATADDDEEVDGDVDGADADTTAPDGERRKARGGAPSHIAAMKASASVKPQAKR